MYWYEKAAVYHIYPLGYCGCEKSNDFSSEPSHAILKVIDQIPDIKKMGFTAIYFGPVFESSAHGYDTADYTKIDRRLGTNEDFAKVCEELHKNDIKVVLDGVFNHVGREFWAFKDVREKKFSSQYKDWFHVREGNSGYNDGFYYEGWEGHYELVKLNLWNGDVKNYIKECITGWVKEFGIDGLRLDVAYCLEPQFLKELRGHCKWLREDFWLLGETLHGDYNRWMNPEMLDSVTNYECYKGIYSSFNSMNMFEIAHSLNRQFGKEQWCLYRGKLLYCFADNHDVSRLATILTNKAHLPLVYTLLFTMPGIPSVYYMSEFSEEGDKHHGDDALRRPYEKRDETELTKHISALAKIHTENAALCVGDYTQLQLTNRQYAFARHTDGNTVVTMINADDKDFGFNVNYGGGWRDAVTGEAIDLSQQIVLGAYQSRIFVADK